MLIMKKMDLEPFSFKLVDLHYLIYILYTSVTKF